MTDEPFVRLNYAITDSQGNSMPYDNEISLITTPCNLGGVRYWFICPLSRNGLYCGRRTGTLYLASGGSYFGCRYCYDLSYESRNESRLGRPGGIGYSLVIDRKIGELSSQIKRWTWRGKPTKKARKLKALRAKLHAHLHSPLIKDLLLGKF
jgi:hypothetical protein